MDVLVWTAKSSDWICILHLFLYLSTKRYQFCYIIQKMQSSKVSW